jgi:hypothetical protein
MQLSASPEATSRSADQEFSDILWTLRLIALLIELHSSQEFSFALLVCLLMMAPSGRNVWGME